MKSPWLIALFLTGILIGPVSAQPSSSAKPVGLADKLILPFSNEKAFSEIPLESALELISLRAEVPILFDPLLKQHASDTFYPQEPVALPKLKDVRLAVIFKMLLEPLGLTYLVMPDHILITTPSLAVDRTGLKRDDIVRGSSRSDAPPAQPELAQVSASDKPLADVLKQLAELTGRSIILAPQARELSQTPITATIRNAQVEDTVAVVADMAGLTMIKKGGILYVTTPEKADEWKERDEESEALKAMREREQALVIYLRQMEAQLRAMDAGLREQDARIQAMLAERDDKESAPETPPKSDQDQ